VRKKKKGYETIRKGIKEQLAFLSRNLKNIKLLVEFIGVLGLSLLSKKQYKDLLVIAELYRQQEIMYRQTTNHIEDRIVSISQPYVRPIVRGKEGIPVEFGAKISISVVEGFCFIEKLSWDAYNEAKHLIEHAETYEKRFGCYPESIHADKIYRNRENIEYCKLHGIRLMGPKLGRPVKANEANKEQRKADAKQMREDEIIRIQVEGKFGNAKRRYNLGLVMTKLAQTSECVIGLTFLVMNLGRLIHFFCIVMEYMGLTCRGLVHPFDHYDCLSNRT